MTEQKKTTDKFRYMSSEIIWQEQKKNFLAQISPKAEDKEFLSQYRMMMEQIKSRTISFYPNDEVLRQQIILLFHEATLGTEMILAKGNPVLSYETEIQEGKARSILKKILESPVTGYVMPIAGLLFSLIVGMSKMPFSGYCALFFAAAIIITYFQNKQKDKQFMKRPTIKQELQLELIDAQITRQMKQLDKHIEDLKVLHQDTIKPLAETQLDSKSINLCQYVWALANSNYPVETALYTAENILSENDLEWITYTPEKRAYFNIMPTKKQSRTVFPAIQKISDGTLVTKGQHIESE